MLRVTTIHASGAAASARDYTRYLAQDGPESEGRWSGRQADGLGLAGTVETGELEALLSGHDPVSGTRLGGALVDRYDRHGNVIPAVAGFDATFSAPKSVSVWWALTGDPGIAEAHDTAVGAVLAHLERYGATTRVRAGGGRQHPDTLGLVMATFRQATSREDDPQLHTHVVISAKVRAADGRWMALDARYLKGKQRALGGLYQSVLRAELAHRYGVAWGPISTVRLRSPARPPSCWRCSPNGPPRSTPPCRQAGRVPGTGRTRPHPLGAGRHYPGGCRRLPLGQDRRCGRRSGGQVA